MDKKLKLMIIVLSAVLLALGVFALVLVLTDGPGETPQNQGGQQIIELPEEDPGVRPSESVELPSESVNPEDILPEYPEIEDSTVNQSTTPTTQKPTEPVAVDFPYAIDGTSLVISKIDSYDGIFLEDGSDRSVTGICALVLTNNGKTDVEYANITIEQEGRSLIFKATVLKAGCTMVVQEANAAAYAPGGYMNCSADVAEVEALEMSADKVKVVENANGSFTVTNLTKETIPVIRIFYKFALTKGSVYVGGITYTAKVENLAPGASQTVNSTHYSVGSSEVVMVRLYDDA